MLDNVKHVEICDWERMYIYIIDLQKGLSWTFYTSQTAACMEAVSFLL